MPCVWQAGNEHCLRLKLEDPIFDGSGRMSAPDQSVLILFFQIFFLLSCSLLNFAIDYMFYSVPLPRSIRTN
ncbi:hypothetical protein POX_b02439 [Penicillium oxalicum]|uniref:Uncharacterized protein n=1 Tax=Penicillium oxalicum (strain 114-2 / CGMCC 5302) TaxID=933388 RepID=S8AWA4_PENO1|nr:hypothetical protein POX_b02439 [Penicillium oxalicum]EPS30553.1 hypothetical protein PDE_05505 [Penicillium oxalicum 114-2]KAI2792402.1 hypothetical protein POX_b02439 [Penicillium oxalicum]